MSEEQSIGALIEARANKAPRITPADIEANIAQEHYFTAHAGIAGAAFLRNHPAPPPLSDYVTYAGDPTTLLTFCVLVLRNGFTVTGESACASPENFDAEIGKRVARQMAVSKIWPLMGYELRTKLAAG